MGWVSAMVKEPRHDAVAPRLPAVPTMEADMAALVGQQRREGPVRRPIIATIESAGNPWIVHRAEHQGGDANAGHEAGRSATLVVILRTGEAAAWGDEGVIVVPHGSRSQNRGTFGGGHDRAFAGGLELHHAQYVAMIEPVAQPHHVAAGSGKIDRRTYGRGRHKRRTCPFLAKVFQQHR